MSEPENHDAENGRVLERDEDVWFDPFETCAEWHSPADIAAYAVLGDEARA